LFCFNPSFFFLLFLAPFSFPLDLLLRLLFFSLNPFTIVLLLFLVLHFSFDPLLSSPFSVSPYCSSSPPLSRSYPFSFLILLLFYYYLLIYLIIYLLTPLFLYSLNLFQSKLPCVLVSIHYLPLPVVHLVLPYSTCCPPLLCRSASLSC
jgi:hypothetical protein